MTVILVIGAVALDNLSVTSLSLSDGWQFPDHDVVESKPKLQWTGTQSRTLSVGLRFHADWCDPIERMDALRNLGGAVQAWPVVRGSGAWIGRFVIERVGQTDRWTLPNGTPLWIEGELKMTEWAGAPLAGIGPALVRGVASPLLRRLG